VAIEGELLGKEPLQFHSILRRLIEGELEGSSAVGRNRFYFIQLYRD